MVFKTGGGSKGPRRVRFPSASANSGPAAIAAAALLGPMPSPRRAAALPLRRVRCPSASAMAFRSQVFSDSSQATADSSSANVLQGTRRESIFSWKRRICGDASSLANIATSDTIDDNCSMNMIQAEGLAEVKARASSIAGRRPSAARWAHRGDARA